MDKSQTCNHQEAQCNSVYTATDLRQHFLHVTCMSCVGMYTCPLQTFHLTSLDHGSVNKFDKGVSDDVIILNILFMDKSLDLQQSGSPVQQCLHSYWP